MAISHNITACLWFDSNGEEAAKHYVSIFKDSKIKSVSHYTSEGQDVHGKPPGSVMTVEFELEGRPFVALNGGPLFKHSEAVSFQVFCETQDEVDYFSSKLGEGGEQGPCGWVKDKFGLSWQVTPKVLIAMIKDTDRAKANRAMKAMLQMRKLDIAALQKAYAG
jgi:predicted 3-demethylubiquinone-9 3-methyltransferase (glyoxalase superfamily)